MRVSHLLDEKGAAVTTIRGDAKVADAVAELCRLQIGALVVSDDGVHIEGMVSERDVVRRLNDLKGRLVDEPVSMIMSRTVHTCIPEDDILALMSVMAERRVRHVPVVRDGVLCGIVSIRDIVKSQLENLERDRIRRSSD
jgi:CBS domain-containing protein